MDPLDSIQNIEERLVVKATLAHIPIGGTFELLPLCNMNCDMCFIRLSKKEMDQVGRLRTVDEWLKLAEEMKRAGTLFLLLTGGEPMLYSHFIELYQGLRKLGMIITINTNGTMITEEIANVLAADKPRRVNITLYGSSNETYAKLCHNPQGFDQAMRGIQLLKERHIDIKLNGSIVPENEDEIDDLIEISKQLDLYLKMDTYMYPSHRERCLPFDQQSRLSAKKAGQKAIEIKRKQKTDEEFHDYCHRMLEKLNHEPQETFDSINCRAGKSAFWVTWYGKMTPCIFMKNVETDVFELGFDQAWKELVEKTALIQMPHACQTCQKRDVCQVCSASALCESGHCEEKPQYMCDYIESILEEIKKNHV